MFPVFIGVRGIPITHKTLYIWEATAFYEEIFDYDACMHTVLGMLYGL